jgi:hypothetical protein
MAAVPAIAQEAPVSPDDGADKAATELRDRICALIRLMGNDDYDVRENAEKELTALGEKVVPEVEKALQDEDPEIRSRAGRILRSLELIPEADLKQLENDIFNAILRSAGDEEAGKAIRRVLKDFVDKYRPSKMKTYRSKDKEVVIIMGADGKDEKSGESVDIVDNDAKLAIAVAGNGGNSDQKSVSGGSASAKSNEGIAIGIGGGGAVYQSGGSIAMGGSGGGGATSSGNVGAFGLGGEAQRFGGISSGNGGGTEPPLGNLGNAKKFIKALRKK